MNVYTKIELLYPENSGTMWLIPGVEVIFGKSGNFRFPDIDIIDSAFRIFCGQTKTFLETYTSLFPVLCDGRMCAPGQRAYVDSPFTFGFGRFLFRAQAIQTEKLTYFRTISFINGEGMEVACVPVPAEGSVSFGRGEDAFVKIYSTGMSRLHGVIFLKDNDVYLRISGKNNDLMIDGRSSQIPEVILEGQKVECLGLNIIMN